MALYLVVGGQQWTVERRREPTTRSRQQRRATELFLFFRSADGEIRRSEIADDFPEEPAAALLASVWRHAEVIRGANPGEMTSRGDLVVPRIRDVALYFWRSLVLCCPRCGGRPVLASWFRLRERCLHCGIRLERGEETDYYLGGMFFNIVLAELLFAVVFTIWIVSVWPRVPWTVVQYTLAIAMVTAPIVLYPVSRLMWLALDLLLRPPDDTEMRWHGSESKPDR